MPGPQVGIDLARLERALREEEEQAEREAAMTPRLTTCDGKYHGNPCGALVDPRYRPSGRCSRHDRPPATG